MATVPKLNKVMPALDTDRNTVRVEVRRDIFQQVVLRNASDICYYVPNDQTKHYGF